MKKHIIFDFDDTLTPSYERNQQLFVETFIKYYPNIDQDYLRKFHFERKGTALIDQFTDVVAKFNLDKSPKFLMNDNEKTHQERAGEMEIFEGVPEMLKHFKKRNKIISICSNRDTEFFKYSPRQTRY